MSCSLFRATTSSVQKATTPAPLPVEVPRSAWLRCNSSEQNDSSDELRIASRHSGRTPPAFQLPFVG